MDLNFVKYLLHTVLKHDAVIRGYSETEEQHIKIIVTNLEWLRVFRTLQAYQLSRVCLFACSAGHDHDLGEMKHN